MVKVMEGKRLYEFGPFLLDPAERVLMREGRPVPLTPKVFDLLVVLVENGGRLLGKKDLMEAVWPVSFVEEGNLTCSISSLRKALGEDRHRGAVLGLFELVAGAEGAQVYAIACDERQRMHFLIAQ